uniref:Uncharacterized protein n=1 Tax=Brassica campestris TaxID=3711 RepID=M4E7H3_BRACM
MSGEDLTGTRVAFRTTNLTTMMKCLTQQHVTNKTIKEHLDALTDALTPPPAHDHRKKAVVHRLCCPFMLLPVPCVTSHTAFVFFKVPRKLAQRVKKFVKRRCGKTLQPRTEEDAVKEEHIGVEKGLSLKRMLQEMSIEFGFGSFWRHEDSSDILDVK